MNGNTTTGAGGSGFMEEPGERGPLSFPELLAAHKAFKMAAAGMIEKPRGVSWSTWTAATDLAEGVTPGLCWVLGHLGGPMGRALDLIVRTAGPLTGGLPFAGPDDFPAVYNAVLAPPGACQLCGIGHNPQLPHEMSPLYQQWFFSRHGRRATLADSCAHCAEPVQGLYAAFWSGIGVPWPHFPPGFVPPHWFAAKLQDTFSQCQKFLTNRKPG